MYTNTDMKLSTHPKELLEICNALIRIPTKHPSFTFLDKFLLLSDGATITVRASNLSISTEMSTFATVDEPGKVLIEPILLVSALSGIPDTVSVVSFELIENELLVKATGIEVSLPTYNAEDFPIVPNVEGVITAVMRGSELAEGVKKVHVAAATTDIKPELASVFLNFNNGSCTAVATDGFRLAESVVAVGTLKTDVGIMIPAKFGLDIAKIVSGYDAIELVVVEDLLKVQFSAGVLVVRLVNGNYPDYKQIIPSGSLTDITVLKEDVVRACRTVSGFTDQFTKIDVTAKPESGELIVSVPRSEKGAGLVTLHATVVGDEISMRMSAKNILDALSGIDDSSITLKFNGPSRPVVVTGFHNKQTTMLMMPMSR